MLTFVLWRCSFFCLLYSVTLHYFHETSLFVSPAGPWCPPPNWKTQRWVVQKDAIRKKKRAREEEAQRRLFRFPSSPLLLYVDLSPSTVVKKRKETHNRLAQHDLWNCVAFVPLNESLTKAHNFFFWTRTKAHYFTTAPEQRLNEWKVVFSPISLWGPNFCFWKPKSLVRNILKFHLRFIQSL